MSVIDFDTAAAANESAPAALKLLSAVVPAYNELQELVASYRAATDIDEAVKGYVESPTTPEHKELAKQIAQAKALIARNEAILTEAAPEVVRQSIAPDFDEAKAKAKVNDTKNELRKNLETVRNAFKLFGLIEAQSTTPTGRESDWKGVDKDGYGDILVQVMQGIPNRLEKTGDSDTDSPEAVAKREVRKAAKEWARANGREVQDKGALSKDVLNDYLATNEADHKKWENANK